MQFGSAVSAKNTLMIGAWLLVVVFSGLFIYTIARVLLLIFAGILIAVFLHGCGEWICRHTRLSYRWGLSLTILSLLAFFALWLAD